jgi:hypothetical protein
VERVGASNNVSLSLILSMIGGAFIIIGGLDLTITLVWHFSTFTGIISGVFYVFTEVYPHWLTIIIIFFSLTAGATVIVSACKMYKESGNKLKWGLLIVLGSIAGLFCIGGFGLGGILGIIGGGISLSRKL